MPIDVHRPPKIKNTDNPSVFLAGPIQGAPNWQAEAEDNLAEAIGYSETVTVFNPRAENMDHGKEAQIKWEKINLKRARNHGVILFWFAAQDFSIEDYPEDRAYAQTSRIEFGRAIGWRDYQTMVRLSVGIDPAYRGNADYITSCGAEHQIPVHQSLAEVCLNAVRLSQIEIT